MTSTSRLERSLRHRMQRGVSMLFALIALVVLTLGAVALVRSVDTGAMVLGNLGFKQDALAAGSIAAESAVAFIAKPPLNVNLDNDNPAYGYYATSRSSLDPTGRTVATALESLVLVDWNNDECDVPGRNSRQAVCLRPTDAKDVGGGNSTRYVITRLCEPVPANPALKTCIAPVVGPKVTPSQHGALSYSTPYYVGGGGSGTYYRIVTRTVGARGTVSYSETMVLL